MKPKISVITISYNSAKYIQLAIESVLAQCFTDFEYIIGDDCSTDNTWEIINEYDDFRIKKYRNEKNIGEYPNRNKSLEFATGEYVIWIDGDDIFYPHGLEFMVKMLDAFPNSAMAMSCAYRKDIIFPYELSPYQIFMLDFFGESVTHFGFPYTLFRTTILKNEGGLSENYRAGDTFIKRYLSLKYKSVVISDGLAWWRIRDGQASGKLKIDKSGHIELLNMNYVLLNNKNCPLNENEKKLAIKYMYSGFFRSIILKYLLKLKVIKFFLILIKSKIPIKYYLFVFVKQKYKYSGLNDGLPLSISINENPFSKL